MPVITLALSVSVLDHEVGEEVLYRGRGKYIIFKIKEIININFVHV